MEIGNKKEYYKQVKKCFTEVKGFYSKLVEKYGESVVKSAFNKKLNWEREKAKLLKRKEVLEAELVNVEEELK